MLENKHKERLVQLSHGVMVEQDVLNVVKKIQEYDENLSVKYLNPDTAYDYTDAPYALYERCPDGLERLVMYIWELDDRVLQRIYAADNARNNVLATVDSNNCAVFDSLSRRYREEMDEAADIVISFLKSDKNNKWSFRDSKTGEVKTIEDRGNG